jgi:hypothetical protein
VDWIYSLLYRRRKRVALPVCRRCFILFQAARIMFWFALIDWSYPVTKLIQANGDLHGAEPTLFAPLVDGLSLIGFAVAAMWIWYRPVDGERQDIRLRLFDVAPAFKHAFLDRPVTRRPGATVRGFTWAGPELPAEPPPLEPPQPAPTMAPVTASPGGPAPGLHDFFGGGGVPSQGGRAPGAG